MPRQNFNAASPGKQSLPTASPRVPASSTPDVRGSARSPPSSPSLSSPLTSSPSNSPSPSSPSSQSSSRHHRRQSSISRMVELSPHDLTTVMDSNVITPTSSSPFLASPSSLSHTVAPTSPRSF